MTGRKFGWMDAQGGCAGGMPSCAHYAHGQRGICGIVVHEGRPITVYGQQLPAAEDANVSRPEVMNTEHGDPQRSPSATVLAVRSGVAAVLYCLQQQLQMVRCHPPCTYNPPCHCHRA